MSRIAPASLDEGETWWQVERDMTSCAGDSVERLVPGDEVGALDGGRPAETTAAAQASDHARQLQPADVIEIAPTPPAEAKAVTTECAIPQRTLPRRILAVVEGLKTDDEVCRRATSAVEASGGFLTLVAVIARLWPTFDCGSLYVPSVGDAYLRADAQRALERAAVLIPPDVALVGVLDYGPVVPMIARRVEAAAHDLVICRRRRIFPFMRRRLWQ